MYLYGTSILFKKRLWYLDFFDFFVEGINLSDMTYCDFLFNMFYHQFYIDTDAELKRVTVYSKSGFTFLKYLYPYTI